MRWSARSQRTARRQPPSRRRAANRSVEALHAQCRERAVVLDLHAEHHRPAAHLAVLNVLLRAAAHLDARIKALSAVRTACAHELLGRDPGTLRPRLIDGLQSIELVDLLCIGTC